MTTAHPVPPVEAPRFTIVTAVYNVATYLPAFIASVDAQTFGPEGLEVVAVDDGSTDDSLALLHAWAERAAYPVVVLTKENGGQSTARNLGLDHARGEWVTFTDPDDVIEPGYLAGVDAFLTAEPGAVLVACNLLLLQDRTGQVEDEHPLRHRFRGKARLRDLDREPAYFFGSAPVAFFRRSDVERLGLRFDPAIRPNFEDGHFTGIYLLSFERPLVGFVPQARYQYRKRADTSSTTGSSARDRGRYTTVLRLGYLDLLRRAAADRDGRIPEWLQNLILYELSWIITLQLRAGGSSSSAVAEASDEFHGLMVELTGLLDPEVVDRSPVSRLNQLWRDVLLHAWSGEDWQQSPVQVTHFDRAQGLVRLEYRYVGTAPAEVCVSGGVPVRPVYAKTRDVSFVGRVVLHERSLWLPAGKAIRIDLNGRSAALDTEEPRRGSSVATVPSIRRHLDRHGYREDPEPWERPTVDPEPNAARILRLARSRPVRRVLGRAWVLMDRVHDAGDNGERLFEYLRAERPDINAWFTIRRDAPEWAGLRRRHGRRVVAYGSLRWKLLLLNAEHLVSSHADQPVTAPREITEGLGVRPEWRFTFLQHGVIKDDLSNWLNPKSIDTFVTSTRAEQESIAGDHNGYAYSSREARLTGLPRFDRLREIGARVGVPGRDLILVAPTWRNWLTRQLELGSQERELSDDFASSEFATSWLDLLGSAELARAAADLGLTIAFLPHPNLREALSAVDLPAGVEPFTFEGDVQELFARSAVLVTDYSSMAFNAAYLDIPVVYFQFDRDRVLAGEHVGSRGYYDYERDGYGPVRTELAAAVAAVVESARTRTPAPEYQARIEAAFPERDGRCCERVVAAITESTRKAPAAEPL
ncbi:bifunctional glycosyltransferase/CDP-glycerol:glycerophosphate glycerophosphotransferase [Nocardioides marmoriginsengisoli]|uniref:bifunctional glycosyltransferase/CDP-glycerol:glycerophosphate glycerophosphotransferase n=1 Tax=Nocardioides marmoriginsengisoli TaxID=661483 RepID=UPI00160CCE2D|nr:CDP-glycerol glycerophosphotransferase family protein [Nocardioides marmoriginsengisoli]